MAPCAWCGKEATSVCVECRGASYCSRDCQREHWHVHKAVCKTDEEVLDDDKGVCWICLEEGGLRGCACRGTQRVHIECFNEYIKKIGTDPLRCPQCHTPFVGRLARALLEGLPTPSKIENKEDVRRVSCSAALSLEQGNVRDALGKEIQLLKTVVTREGEESPVTFEHRLNIASILCALGHIAGSRRCLDGLTAMLQDHPNRQLLLDAKFIRAELHRKSDDYDNALRSHREVLRECKTVLERRRSLNAVGAILAWTQNEAAHALELLSECHGITLRVYGPRHTETAEVQRNLSSAYSALGQHEHARQSALEARSVYEEHYGNDHADVAQTDAMLGRAMLSEAADAASRGEDAQDLLQRAAQKFRRAVEVLEQSQTGASVVGIREMLQLAENLARVLQRNRTTSLGEILRLLELVP